mmetsp:Transcript_36639/g.117664  ORF Transcript_36639/g.117664 Transcript_36639/m.117664 type:complete len:291 (-) Transcript_36639:63-935(-)
MDEWVTSLYMSARGLREKASIRSPHAMKPPLTPRPADRRKSCRQPAGTIGAVALSPPPKKRAAPAKWPAFGLLSWEKTSTGASAEAVSAESNPDVLYTASGEPPWCECAYAPRGVVRGCGNKPWYEIERNSLAAGSAGPRRKPGHSVLVGSAASGVSALGASAADARSRPEGKNCSTTTCPASHGYVRNVHRMSSPGMEERAPWPPAVQLSETASYGPNTSQPTERAGGANSTREPSKEESRPTRYSSPLNRGRPSIPRVNAPSGSTRRLSGTTGAAVRAKGRGGGGSEA